MWDCEPAVLPSNCSNGALYMRLRSTRESCQMAAFLAVSKKKLAAAANLTDPAAAAIRTACQKSIACETDTVGQWLTSAGKNASCTGFFSSDYIRSAFPWAATCNQAKICSDYAAVGTPAPPPSVGSSAPGPRRGTLLAAALAAAAVAALAALS